MLLISKRRKLLLVLLLPAVAIFVSFRFDWLRSLEKRAPTTTASNSCRQRKTFLCAVAARASSDKHIILAVTDNAYVDMAFNLYESSFRVHGIRNFLFVGIGKRPCTALAAASLPCFHYGDVVGHETASNWHTPGFYPKVTFKVSMVVEALSAGYTVLLTDVDLVYVKNPMPFIKKAVRGSDMAAMMDDVRFNTGFIIVKPTTCSIKIWSMAQASMSTNPKLSDQPAVNAAITSTKRNKNATGCASLKMVELDTDRFTNGKIYFKNFERSFPKKWSGCVDKINSNCTVVAHTNYIIGYTTKIYRLKECLLWRYDKDGYYSSKSARYLTYDNSLQHVQSFAANISREMQLTALKSALAIGRVLNRIVILPRFHCNQENQFIECPLSSLVRIASFDSQFGASHRESSFLLNRLVPYSVRKSVASGFDVANIKIVVSASELIDRFGGVSKSILSMGPLHDVRISLGSPKDDKSFDAMLDKGFQRTANPGYN